MANKTERDLYKLFDVREYEIFKIKETGKFYRIENNKLKKGIEGHEYMYMWINSRDKIDDLLKSTIVKVDGLMKGQPYYYVTETGAVLYGLCIAESDLSMYKLGNYYNSVGLISEEDIEFWIEFYANKEQLNIKKYYKKLIKKEGRRKIWEW